MVNGKIGAPRSIEQIVDIAAAFAEALMIGRNEPWIRTTNQRFDGTAHIPTGLRCILSRGCNNAKERGT
ncbi:hypothetical protein A0J57_21435 [Sphingobium sp. 22B]|nr:hypothetical protein A0J57_21435 [Sphingobium sp. 22B]OAP29839.1 hypothetical protein A8O16_21635 [Sphingobium sp. 20006FA]